MIIINNIGLTSSTMGFECDRFPFAFKSGIISQANSSKQFQEAFLSSLDASCDLFICNIFSNQSITNEEKIDLDKCFIPCDETFTRKQLPHICPLLNLCLLCPDTLKSEIKLKFIAEYCVYLGVKRVGISLDVLNKNYNLLLLQGIANILKKARIGVIIVIPAGSNLQDMERTWKSFIAYRQQLADKVCWELCLQLKSANSQQALQPLLDRWLGENVAYISFDQNSFGLNQKGYPVLSTFLEHFLKKCLKAHIHIMVSLQHDVKSKIVYFKYYLHVLTKLTENMTENELAAQQLKDILQTPLQPYRDNLDAQIYDIFEKDKVKYEQYEIAIRQALSSLNKDFVVAYYVGSGKGLILQKFIMASKKTSKKIKIYCIQKNPFPLQTLKRRIARNKWSKMVQVVEADIKEYQMPQHPDIIFSQLLGGLGDNQLSPECLKWAEKNCSKNTIFIPELYRSFIRPVSSHSLHNQLSKTEKQQYFTVQFGKYYSPFQSQQIWQFHHPLASDQTFCRKSTVEWIVKEAVCIHGFEGTFDCNLFGKAYFSIVPENKDKNFYSWFSLFFSFLQEQTVEKGEKIIVQIGRFSDGKKVWYQWRYEIQDKEQKERKKSEWHNHKGSFSMYLTSEQ